MATTIDTLRLSKRFKDVRLTDEQAELFAEVFRETQEASVAQLATKADLDHAKMVLQSDLDHAKLALQSDLDRAKSVLQSDLDHAKLSLQSDLERLDATLRAAIAESKIDLLKWIIPLLTAQVIMLVGLFFK